ncbi:MAG TPA: nucleotide exchange factor GrpE [Blastocatellia bacterium]|nr:nucleotide exchange factor GrpE [Blastocatellia bacterium]
MPDKTKAPRNIPISFDSTENVEAEAQEAKAEAKADATAEEEADLQTDELAAAEVIESEDDPSVDETGEVSEPDIQEPSPFSKLRSQVDVLMSERASLYDKLLRRQAEFENYRKRVERERAELYQHGREDVLLQFLPVVDNFERALSSLEESEGDAEALRRGVELIHKQFSDALTKLGLETVEAVGHTFDPHVHEAVTTEATDKHKENTVIEEFQRGYKIGDRLLRPAKVKVASTPEK